MLVTSCLKFMHLMIGVQEQCIAVFIRDIQYFQKYMYRSLCSSQLGCLFQLYDHILLA